MSKMEKGMDSFVRCGKLVTYYLNWIIISIIIYIVGRSRNETLSYNIPYYTHKLFDFLLKKSLPSYSFQKLIYNSYLHVTIIWKKNKKNKRIPSLNIIKYHPNETEKKEKNHSGAYIYFDLSQRNVNYLRERGQFSVSLSQLATRQSTPAPGTTPPPPLNSESKLMLGKSWPEVGSGGLRTGPKAISSMARWQPKRSQPRKFAGITDLPPSNGTLFRAIGGKQSWQTCSCSATRLYISFFRRLRREKCRVVFLGTNSLLVTILFVSFVDWFPFVFFFFLARLEMFKEICHKLCETYSYFIFLLFNQFNLTWKSNLT